VCVCIYIAEGSDDEVTVDEMATPRIEQFWYLCLIIEEKGDIDKDINQCIKWDDKSGKMLPQILHDEKIPVGLKGKVYHMIFRPALLYGSKC